MLSYKEKTKLEHSFNFTPDKELIEFSLEKDKIGIATERALIAQKVLQERNGGSEDTAEKKRLRKKTDDDDLN